jgi:hypothetical protein
MLATIWKFGADSQLTTIRPFDVAAYIGLWPCVEELALPNPSNVSSPELPGEKSGCTIY